MPLVLKKRAANISEQMDQPDCDPGMLNNTYRQFHRMNPLISRWRLIYKRFILPEIAPGKTNTLLDIGFGGGDIIFNIAKWAKKDGVELKITGIDSDVRAVDYANSLPADPAIEFKLATLETIKENGRKYDFVISNHLIHHLDHPEFTHMIRHLETIATKRVIFNDIERSDLAYLGFCAFIGPFLRKSFARPDGLRSIRRSFTKAELQQTVPAHWRVYRFFPFRLVLIRDP